MMIKIDLDRWEEILITITRNKTRSLLTAFGIFWGIFMLVFLMGGSQGVQDLMSSTFQGFATNSGFTGSGMTGKAYKGFRKGRWWDLDNKDVERVRRAVPEIETVTAANALWGQTAVYKENQISCNLKGQYPEYARIEEPRITYGRYLNSVDIREYRKVCVIGKRIYDTLFPDGGNPCGTFLRINGIYYQVVGVNETMGNMTVQGNAETSIIIPFTTMQRNYNFGDKVQLLCYTVREGYTVSDAEKKVADVVRKAHIIHPDDKQAIMQVNAEALFSMIDSLFKGIRILSWMVGLGTLLAGAIGVSNIMMVTVRERTVEIGIRRAIGARPRDILSQILSESMVLTTLAGMTGITFSVLILQLVENAVGQSAATSHFQISFWMAVGACATLLVLGLLAGLAPAYRAMAIRPIEAIRDE